MSHFSKLAGTRRSIRKYTNEPLSPQEVEQIMKTVLTAPSSKNSTPWQFVLIEDKEMLKYLSFCKSGGATFIADCALAIIVLTDPMQSGAFIEDGAIAATFIQLQAEDLGLGSCWVQVRGRETEAGQDSEEYIRGILDIPMQLSIGCIVTIGKKEKNGKPHKEESLQWEKIHIGKYRHASE